MLAKETDSKRDLYISDKLELNTILEGHNEDPQLPRKRDYSELVSGENYGVIEGEDYNPNDCQALGNHNHDEHPSSGDDEENEDTESNPGEDIEKRLKL